MDYHARRWDQIKQEARELRQDGSTDVGEALYAALFREIECR